MSPPVRPPLRPPLVALAAALALGAAAPSIAHAAGWTDVTTPLLAGDGKSAGAAWGDIDQDGDYDLYVTYFEGVNVLFRNEGNGVFEDAQRTALAVADSSGGATWADADNDGDLDLFLATLGEDRVFANNGAGAFIEAAGPSIADTANGLSVVWGDYDSDGLVDLYVVNTSGTPKTLYRNVGGGAFADVTTPLLADTGPGRGGVWGDYDDDGDVDLYVSNRGAPNRLYRNEGDGTFVDPGIPLLADPGLGYAVDWVDVDNDGDLDLSLLNNGPNKLFRNEGSGTFSDATAASGAFIDSSFSHGTAWGDFDNDGDPDVYIVNFFAPNRLLLNDGIGFFSDAPDAGPIMIVENGNAAAAADYDGDGDLDLYVTNGEGGNRLFRNDLTNGKHWFQVDLVGTESNRSGIGARVIARTPLGAQIREVTGGSGFLSQGAMTVAFGLGPATRVDTLEIRWPSGIVQTLVEIAANQRITVTEASATEVADLGPARRAGALALSASPDPFRADVTLRFSLSAPSPVRLGIFGADGSRARTIALDSPLAAGPRSIVWDGRDDHGRVVPAGVYLVRLVANGEVATRRVVHLH